MEQLQAKLEAELKRLGNDGADAATKVAAGAPKGAGGAVFDLGAVVIDPDGPPDGQGGGTQPPTGIQFTWTERLTGDYDMNSVVGLPDIVPIAAKWAMRPSYDSPALHGRFASWPTGDPDDSSGGAAGPGAVNWRIARVDGDANGLIGLPDITPIAAHWQESLSGYRVYRKGPGESTFTMLPNPDDASSPLTIPRSKCFPTGQDAPDQSRPVRYSFSDEPPVAGTYEYYVVACLTSETASPVEADVESNHVQVDFQANFPDTAPPNWDTTVGVTAATANADGTITVEFGTATDVAVPPAPASPPVSYTLYYSLQTPMDYSGAAKAAGVESPWVSPILVAGQTYYFAVRAQDSAVPPNEDANTVVMSAVAQGSAVEDHDPPVWTETGADGKPIQGLCEGWTGDQTITIRCAEAMDALSPPVHYDLYYVEDMESGVKVFDPDTDALHPRAVVVQDIPEVYELHNRNRHALSMVVRARDSANPPNETTNTASTKLAAGRAVKRVLDPHFPGLPDTYIEADFAMAVGDPVLHKLYSVYPASDGGINKVYFAELDLDTGQWAAQALPTTPAGQGTTSRKFALSWTHKLWLSYHTDTTHWLRRSVGGQWQAWEPGEGRSWGYYPEFDHNSNPAFFTYEPSTTVPGRYAMYYEWYSEAQGQWERELASDPGGYPDTFLRPDGVLQLTAFDRRDIGDTTPSMAHLRERSPGGVWSTVMEGYGPGEDSGSITPDHSYPLQTWAGGWGWTAMCNLRGSAELLVATPTGYEYLPPVLDNEGNWIVGTTERKCWPAAGGGYHALPYDIRQADGTYFRQWQFGGTDFSKRLTETGLILNAAKVVNALTFDPLTGYEAFATRQVNCQTGQDELVLLTHVPGDTIFADAP
jgi:hypothetical protein